MHIHHPQIEPHRVLGCVHFRPEEPGLAGFSIGYESGVWRQDDLISLIFDYLPDFALRHREKQDIESTDVFSILVRAAKSVYGTDKYKRRGEFGEVLLHTILCRHFNTLPAISKLYYKDGDNETVKGYDAVHVVANDDNLELWLGEVKFYENFKSAVYSVVKELHQHTERNYLKAEFRLVSNKIDESWPHADRLKLLIDDDVSLDHIFTRVRIPVLLTYNSEIPHTHNAVTDEFINELVDEFNANHAWFKNRDLPANVRIHLILVPLRDKAALSGRFDQKLKMIQSL